MRVTGVGVAEKTFQFFVGNHLLVCVDFAVGVYQRHRLFQSPSHRGKVNLVGVFLTLKQIIWRVASADAVGVFIRIHSKVVVVVVVKESLVRLDSASVWFVFCVDGLTMLLTDIRAINDEFSFWASKGKLLYFFLEIRNKLKNTIDFTF